MRAAASGVEEVSPESSRKRGVGRVGQNSTLRSTFILGGGGGGEGQGRPRRQRGGQRVACQQSRVQGSGESAPSEGEGLEGLAHSPGPDAARRPVSSCSSEPSSLGNILFILLAYFIICLPPLSF